MEPLIIISNCLGPTCLAFKLIVYILLMSGIVNYMIFISVVVYGIEFMHLLMCIIYVNFNVLQFAYDFSVIRIRCV